MSSLNNEWLTLLVGALIGGGISYLFTMREKSITREFELYQKGMSYLQSLYGFISVLLDLAEGYVRALEKGKAQISDMEGFIYLTPKEILDKYKSKYEEFTKFMGDQKNKGNEVFLRKDLAKDVTEFWALADYFYEKGTWDSHLADDFNEVSIRTMDRIERMLGIRKTFEKPKWLKPTELRAIIRGVKTVGKKD